MCDPAGNTRRHPPSLPGAHLPSGPRLRPPPPAIQARRPPPPHAPPRPRRLLQTPRGRGSLLLLSHPCLRAPPPPRRPGGGGSIEGTAGPSLPRDRPWRRRARHLEVSEHVVPVQRRGGPGGGCPGHVLLGCNGEGAELDADILRRHVR
ncbi:unnamed protein product [Linum tenue]|uniref:Uncharacterized protein n=1 Tax=Linum tenue TaxID=586396 RepID=A0AAV0HPC7_9ROSI|nr:unnamed protein product [Linum tenue]